MVKIIGGALVVGAVSITACTTVVVRPEPAKTVTHSPSSTHGAAASPSNTAPQVTPTTTAPSQVPAQTPQASQDAHVCLPAGNCSQQTQENIAAYEGITDPHGTNGCLAVGDCSASQQQGIATFFTNTGAPGW